MGARAAIAEAVSRERPLAFPLRDRRDPRSLRTPYSNFCRFTEFCSARSSLALALMNTTTDPLGTRPRELSSCFKSVPVVSASFPMPVVSGVTPRYNRQIAAR